MSMESVTVLPRPEVTAQIVFDIWLTRLGQAIEHQDAGGFVRLFESDGYWRDILSFSWTRRTFSGPGEIGHAFSTTVAKAGAHRFRIAEGRTSPRFAKRSGQGVIEGWFEFDSRFGKNVGFARLLPEAARPQDAKAWLVLTTLHELHGFEEKIGPNRPTGEEFSQIQSPENWKQRRDKEQAFADHDPEVLIIGAGQGGLILAARLRQMGVDALVIERTDRVGDVWRARYNNLTLHNEVPANHFPYLQFPETWPTYLPKDMFADWLEAYGKFMELNVWTQTELGSATYDESSRSWHVTLQCAGQKPRSMRCKHLVAALGVSGGIPKRPEIAGLRDFGGTILHSAEYKSGTDWAGKRTLVIGTGNSGHDIAQDLYVNGAEKVTLLQRGPTCVISLEPGAAISYAVFKEDTAVEDTDLMIAALPYPLLIDSYQWITKRTNELDHDLLAQLSKAGFRTHIGKDETGFQLMYLRGLGGYYIDVGCCKLVIEGKIKVVQDEDKERFVRDGLRMKDGTVAPYDLVVLATGFESMQENIRRMLGDVVADRVGELWGFDERYNMRGMWTRTGQDGFWAMGGAITEARFNSRYLALEIKASLEGLLPERIDMPPV